MRMPRTRNPAATIVNLPAMREAVGIDMSDSISVVEVSAVTLWASSCTRSIALPSVGRGNSSRETDATCIPFGLYGRTRKMSIRVRRDCVQ